MSAFEKGGALQRIKRLGSPPTARRGGPSGSGQRIVPILPPLEPTGERPHRLDPAALQRQRHPGARGFVGSATIEDDLAIERDLVQALLQLLERDVDGTGDGARIRLEV